MHMSISAKLHVSDILEFANLDFIFLTLFWNNLSINIYQIPILFFLLAKPYKNVSQTHPFPRVFW